VCLFQLHVVLMDFCQHMLIEDSDIFFLPKPFWALPFSAYRARLHGQGFFVYLFIYLFTGLPSSTI
jgi:hypothetical protein